MNRAGWLWAVSRYLSRLTRTDRTRAVHPGSCDLGLPDLVSYESLRSLGDRPASLKVAMNAVASLLWLLTVVATTGCATLSDESETASVVTPATKVAAPGRFAATTALPTGAVTATEAAVDIWQQTEAFLKKYVPNCSGNRLYDQGFTLTFRSSAKGPLVSGVLATDILATGDKIVYASFVRSPGPFRQSEAEVEYRDIDIRMVENRFFVVATGGDIQYSIGDSRDSKNGRSAIIRYMDFLDDPENNITDDPSFSLPFHFARAKASAATKIFLDVRKRDGRPLSVSVVAYAGNDPVLNLVSSVEQSFIDQHMGYSPIAGAVRRKYIPMDWPFDVSIEYQIRAAASSTP